MAAPNPTSEALTIPQLSFPSFPSSISGMLVDLFLVLPAESG